MPQQQHQGQVPPRLLTPRGAEGRRDAPVCPAVYLSAAFAFIEAESCPDGRLVFQGRVKVREAGPGSWPRGVSDSPRACPRGNPGTLMKREQEEGADGVRTRGEEEEEEEEEGRGKKMIMMKRGRKEGVYGVRTGGEEEGEDNDEERAG